MLTSARLYPGPLATLEELPSVMRIARRGRAFEAVADEAGVSVATLRRAEAGDAVTIDSLRRICSWIQVAVVVEPASPGPEAEPTVPGVEKEPLHEEAIGDGGSGADAE